MNSILGNRSRGLVFVISAPAGAGKNTLVNLLKEEFPCVVESVSCTTRGPRPGEKEGVDYYFLTPEQFKEKIAAGQFLEYAEVYGNYYGTSKAFVELEQTKGNHVVLVIDTQGAMQLKGKIAACYIFIAPPSLEQLRFRLLGRNTESKEEAEKRLSMAEHELAMMEQYDYCIVNEDLATAYQVLRSILISEEHKIIKRNHGI